MTVKGVIRGRIIELDQEPGLPEGQEVKVTLETYGKPSSPPNERLRSSFGGWAEDATELDAFLEQVRRDREDRRMESNT